MTSLRLFIVGDRLTRGEFFHILFEAAASLMGVVDDNHL